MARDRRGAECSARYARGRVFGKPTREGARRGAKAKAGSLMRGAFDKEEFSERFDVAASAALMQ